MPEARRLSGLFAGPVLLLAMLLLPLPEGMTPEGQRVAGVAILMAVWWLTEAIPIPATALLPVLLFPVLGVTSASEVTRAYGHHLIYLFLGGFLMAVCMQKWNLHHRIALHTIRIVGVTPQRLILGFMLATAFISMWISNTATTMMMVTIAVAVLGEISGRMSPQPGQQGYATGLMLSIGYAASIGGTATLIGTPPNAIFAGVLEKQHNISISFLDWMKFGLPLALLMLVLTWLYLTRVRFRCGMQALPGGRAFINEQLTRLGPMAREEKLVALVLGIVAALWVLRGLFPSAAPPLIKDSTIAIAGALALFMIPVNLRRYEFLLDWKTAVTVPWDIIILFGGGFALANGFQDSGLSGWLAQQLDSLHGADILLVLGTVVLLVIFLTEVTSNTATASLLLPVMGALASAIGVSPVGLMAAAVVAASFAFMLPVATPPNAIVFSSRYVTITQMAGAGLWLNLLGVLVITGCVYVLLPLVWGISL